MLGRSRCLCPTADMRRTRTSTARWRSDLAETADEVPPVVWIGGRSHLLIRCRRRRLAGVAIAAAIGDRGSVGRDVGDRCLLSGRRGSARFGGCRRSVRPEAARFRPARPRPTDPSPPRRYWSSGRRGGQRTSCGRSAGPVSLRDVVGPALCLITCLFVHGCRAGSAERAQRRQRSRRRARRGGRRDRRVPGVGRRNTVVSSGEIVLLSGPNGAGKTSILRPVRRAVADRPRFRFDLRPRSGHSVHLDPATSRTAGAPQRAVRRPDGGRKRRVLGIDGRRHT